MRALASLLLISARADSPPPSGTAVQVWPCSAGLVAQTWSMSSGGTPNDNVRLGGAAGIPWSNLNLNTLGFSNSTGGILNVWSNAPSTPWGQQWVFASGQLRSETNGLCAGSTNASGVLPAGTAVVQVPCSNGAAASWAYDAATGLLHWELDPSLCLDAGSSVLSCAEGGNATFCNTSLPVTARVQLLLDLMLPVEKAAMLAASNNGVPRLGVPPQRYGEALHGVLSGCGAAAPPTADGFVSSGCPTSFPTGLALGSSFNRSLWRAVGATIGTEARALFNQGGIAQTSLFTPDVNPCRDVRWGRCMEVPSEDPVHAAEYAAAYIEGFQGEAGGFLRAVAMPKHFQAYDQEGNFGPHDRSSFCAPVSLQSVVAYHMPPFFAALTRGRAAGLMCSTNGYGIDGVPGQASCAHAEFNNGILREQWGADFSMVTDGNGVGYLYENYGHGALNCGDGATGPTNAVRVGLRGGVDVELGETLNNFALAAIADGNITQADVDLALSRTLRWLFRLGLMDPRANVPATALGPADVDTSAARSLAREAAAQAVVLLRNNVSAAAGAPLIPLNLAGVRTVAVVGPSADAWETMLANYHGSNTVAAAHSPFAALAATLHGRANVTTAPGCANVLCEDSSGFAAAVAVSAAADVVVLVCGGAPWRGGPGPFNSTEGEEYDRASITLPGLQEELITTVLGTGRPVVLVIERGGPIALSPALLADPRLTTVLSVCYPGEMGGDGLADVLLGTAAPSGRLPTTSYASGFVDSRSIIDYNFSSGDGVTHLWYTGAPQWPFGFGLSTTTWALTWLDAASTADAAVDAREWARRADPRPYGVNVTNTGARTSDISLLGFVSSGVPGEPLQKMFDFQRTAAVAPGETRTLIFSLPLDAAGRVGRDGAVALHAGVLRVLIGAPGEHMLEARLAVEGSAAVRDAPAI